MLGECIKEDYKLRFPKNFLKINYKDKDIVHLSKKCSNKDKNLIQLHSNKKLQKEILLSNSKNKNNLK